MRLIRCYAELSSTRQTVNEDKALLYEDWKECIWPLATSAFDNLNMDFFGVEKYFAAKTLISSRMFEIDEFHGFGMVPLADLFNHKTGAEDVHFTLSPSLSDSESEKLVNTDSDEQCDSDATGSRGQASILPVIKNSDNNDDLGASLTTNLDDSTLLEMILVKDVRSGLEVFNTYGTLSNAALLHRYGFTEANNPYDIVNIDLELVWQSSLVLNTKRYIRSRVALWKRLDVENVRQDTEYFEISSDGEPEMELLVLLYILSLPEEFYYLLDHITSMGEALSKADVENLPKECSLVFGTRAETRKDLLNGSVCDALLSIANLRESFYKSGSLQDDVDRLKTCCPVLERKKYHSLMLLISERNILQKLRLYAAAAGKAKPLLN
uniref:N-lysine methyltransferase n=1 Tax=Kalanchoe fedtschenkoi TaxID=63787 RepID=A0A7N1A281_KALFE